MSGVSGSAATVRRAPLTSNSMVLVKAQSSQGRLRLLLLVRHTPTRSRDCKLALLGRRCSIMNPPYPDLYSENRGDKTARVYQGRTQLRLAEVAVVIDPAADVRAQVLERAPDDRTMTHPLLLAAGPPMRQQCGSMATIHRRERENQAVAGPPPNRHACVVAGGAWVVGVWRTARA